MTRKEKDSFLRHFENGFFWKKIGYDRLSRTKRIVDSVITIVGRFVSIASKEWRERKKKKRKDQNFNVSL